MFDAGRALRAVRPRYDDARPPFKAGKAGHDLQGRFFCLRDSGANRGAIAPGVSAVPDRNRHEHPTAKEAC